MAAFRAFRQRRPSAVLVAAWHTQYPELARGLERAGHVAPLPGGLSAGEEDGAGSEGLAGWLRSSGLPEGSFQLLPALSDAEVAAQLERSHAAVFASRAESGTNLFATQALAMGVPTLLSANTGHLDLIAALGGRPPCYPLATQGAVPPLPPFGGTAGWGESDVEEMVQQLDMIFQADAKQAESDWRRAGEAFLRRIAWDDAVANLTRACSQ